MAEVKRSRVAIITFLTGLAEPAGALIGAAALSLLKIENTIGFPLAFAAGVMTYITADELIPVAHEYGYKHTVSAALLLGIILALMIDVVLS